MQENEEGYIEKKAFTDNSNWESEAEEWLTDKHGQAIKVSRLIHKLDKKDGRKKPRRLIAITKKNKSIGIDTESVFALTAKMRLLAEKYVPDNLK